MPEKKAIPRLIDFPESLRMKYVQLEKQPVDFLTDLERKFLEAQIAEAQRRKKKLG